MPQLVDRWNALYAEWRELFELEFDCDVDDYESGAIEAS